MPDLIITRDSVGHLVCNAYLWSAAKPPVMSSDGKFQGKIVAMMDADTFPDLPPGHSARLVLEDITDHRPVPKIEWVTVGCIDVATLGTSTGLVRRTQYSHTLFRGCHYMADGIVSCSKDMEKSEAREWCEAELRKAGRQ